MVVEERSWRNREWSDVGRKRSNSGPEGLVLKYDRAFGRVCSG